MNLLPWRSLEKNKRLRKMGLRLLLYAICMMTLLFFLKSMLVVFTEKLATQTHSVHVVTKKLNISAAANHAKLLQQLIGVDAKKKLSLTSNRIREQLLLGIVDNLPGNVKLNALSMSLTQLTLTGDSHGLSGVHTYGAALQKQLAWKHITLSHMQSDANNPSILQFSLEVAP